MPTEHDAAIRIIGGHYDGDADPLETPNNWARAEGCLQALLDAGWKPLAHADAMAAEARREALERCIAICAEVRDGKHDAAYSASGIDAGEDFIASLISALIPGARND
jgi:hypothetical protein